MTQRATLSAPDQDAIDRLVRQVVEVAQPLRIILFGSAARGEVGPHSDVNLLVVMPDGTDRRAMMGTLYREVRSKETPVDYLVTTPIFLEKHKDNIGFIYRTILKEGKEVYAA